MARTCVEDPTDAGILHTSLHLHGWSIPVLAVYKGMHSAHQMPEGCCKEHSHHYLTFCNETVDISLDM